MRFFIVVPPGCESICKTELSSLNIEQSSMVIGRGGIEVECTLEQGFALNHVLKSASRVLLRWAEFRVRDFPKLFKKVSELPWGTFFPEQTQFEFVVSARESRLKMKNRIAETCSKAVGKARSASALKTSDKPQTPRAKTVKDSAPVFQVFVRMDQDVCTISLDTSGELLHRRGYRILAPEAPIRENLAAACLLSIASGASAGANQRIRLVDPMMGSGTFLVEALALGKPLRGRNFAYEGFKVFKPAEIKKALVTSANLILGSGLPIDEVVGWDISQEALSFAQRYLREISFETEAADKKPLRISIKNQDVFQAVSLDRTTDRGPLDRAVRTWVVCNPPYGERIKIAMPYVEYYSELLQALEDAFEPELCGIILPNKFQISRLRLPKSWGVGEERLKFENGGIPVRFVVYRRDAQ